jgi:hypothetical protein
MSRIAILALTLSLLAAAAGATGIVDDKFVIADEIFDLERLGSGSATYRTYNFAGAIAPTQAGLVFAGTDGKGLSTYWADFGIASCQTNDYLTAADAAATITWRFNKVILDLTQVVFSFTKVCTPFGNCSMAWIRNWDWQQRLELFATRSNGYYNPSTILFISVHAELGGTGLSNTTVNEVVAKVKEEFPGVKVGAGFPTTNFANPGAMPPVYPASFPSDLDVIVTWDYKIADPRQPPYSDPTWPANPFYKYGKIVARLADRNGDGVADQHIFFLVSGFNQTSPPSTGAASLVHESTGVRFDTLLRQWCDFSLKRLQFRNAGLIVWKYNNSYTCQNGNCNSNNCSGLNLFQTGAKTTFQYEASTGSDDLLRAYQAVSNAVTSGGSCFAP